MRSDRLLDSRWTEAEVWVVLVTTGQSRVGCTGIRVGPGWCCRAERAWRENQQPGGAEEEDSAEAEAEVEAEEENSVEVEIEDSVEVEVEVEVEVAVDWFWFWYQLMQHWRNLFHQRKEVSAESSRLNRCWIQNQDPGSSGCSGSPGCRWLPARLPGSPAAR